MYLQCFIEFYISCISDSTAEHHVHASGSFECKLHGSGLIRAYLCHQSVSFDYRTADYPSSSCAAVVVLDSATVGMLRHCSCQR
jgi:hypothetical protein